MLTQITILNTKKYEGQKISYYDVKMSTHYLTACYLKTEVGV